jgi:class 3 adenylate cyclase/tetratricopeptide (TPR) repeat protein
MSASTCAACGFANPAGALYCGSCGNALGRACPSCGTVVSPELAFCTSCGAALASDGRAPGLDERKVVSVLFVDLVGFTSRAEQLDPEDVGNVQAPYFQRARNEIENYGGTVEKYIGDAVMAVFGAPVAHEDDPERAVLAALAIREAIGELNLEDPGLGLHIRIGITTGEVLVRLESRPERGEAIAAGDIVNTASRLQGAAPVDGILVDEATRRASERVVEYREADSIPAKGKSQPVPVWEAVTRIGRFGVDIAFQGRAPLVGRDNELAILRDAVTRVQRERTTQLVTLVGLPGIGKSRLLWELYQSVHTDPDALVTWRQGRSLPYGEGVAYWAVAEITKSHAGILESDDARIAEAKLRAAVAGVLGESSETGWVVRHLRPLAGLPGGKEPGPRGRAEAFAAWRRFFEALAEQRPLILVFEDLQWADDDLLDFVDDLAEWTSGVPLLIVCSTRPELFDRRPAWSGGKRNATTISLSPLSDSQTSALLASLVEDEPVSDAQRRELLARAGGNPLYAEEYVRMLTQAEHELPLPESVQGIIAARLDTLAPDEKGLIQAAAIVGKVFWPGPLVTMLDVEREDAEWGLHTLERKEFVRRERRSSIAGETAYVFRHVLVRDVASNQIPRGRRANLHRLAAEWIESLSGDRPEDLADMVAYHYSRALDLTRSTNGDERELVDRARTALREAGDRSFALNAFPPAARFYREALDLWPDADVQRPHLLLAYGRALFHAEGAGMNPLSEAAEELLDAGAREASSEAEIMLGELYWLEGRPDDSLRHIESALELVEGETDAPARAAAEAALARFYTNLNDPERALPLGLDAVRQAEKLGLDELRVDTLTTLGVARTMLGDLGGLDDLRQSVEAAEVLNLAEVVRASANLASMLVHHGRLGEAFELYERGRVKARRFGDGRALRWLAIERMYEEYWRGDYEEALSSASSFLGDTDGTPTLPDAGARLVRGHVRLAIEDLEGALEDSAEALEFAREAKDLQNLLPAVALRARVLAVVRRGEEAEGLVAELSHLWAEYAYEPASFWTADLAFATLDLSLPLEAPPKAPGTPWLEAARALASGRLAEAAAAYRKIGSRPDEEAALQRAGAAARGSR